MHRHVNSGESLVRSINHTACTGMVSKPYELYQYGFWECSLARRNNHIASSKIASIFMNYIEMSIQVTRMCGKITTVLALLWFELFINWTCMLFGMICSWRRKIAQLAQIRLQSFMNCTNMSFMATCLCSGIITEIALVWFYSLMNCMKVSF